MSDKITKQDVERLKDHFSPVYSSHANYIITGIGLTPAEEEANRKMLENLDDGIRHAVRLLREYNVETYESCEGGDGHAYVRPTIRFHGDIGEGYRALAICLTHGLPIDALNKHWSVIDKEPVGPTWELVFYEKMYEESEE